MGGVCSTKHSDVEESRDRPRERFSSRGSNEYQVSRLDSSRREVTRESFRVRDGSEARSGLVDNRLNESRHVQNDHFERRTGNSDIVINRYPSIRSLTVPKATEGEQVAAGWPTWLSAVAGEAIKGWAPRRADTFEKLYKIGQGTYSSVYKAVDLIHNKIVALKKVRFDNMDPESVKFMAREIIILRSLDHPNVIKLEGVVTSRNSHSIYLVFEYMEHDLTGLASLPEANFTEPQVKCYMKQLLSGLQHIHSRGILHRDIKGANLLIDNEGILKIADFGLASFYNYHEDTILTSRVVTLWYRPPELLLGATHYGVAVDLWSVGCILGELYAGRPIMPGRTEVEQLHKIFKLCGSPSENLWRKLKLPNSTVFKPAQPYKERLEETFKDFPFPVIGLMKTLLAIDPLQRGTATFALNSDYFYTKPFPCDPSSLPKYPPTKVLDAKLQDEAKRQGAAGGLDRQKVDHETKGLKEGRAIQAPDANSELDMSMKRRQLRTSSNSRREFLNSKDETASGLQIVPHRQSQPSKEARKDVSKLHPPMQESFSGPLMTRTWTNKAKKYDDDVSMVSSRVDLSTLSGLGGSRMSQDFRDKLDLSSKLEGNHDHMNHHAHALAISRRMESGPSTKEPSTNAHGFKNSIHFSGPLLAPSNNIDQILKARERHAQEAARRARLEKMRLRTNGQNEGTNQITTNSLYVSTRGGR